MEAEFPLRGLECTFCKFPQSRCGGFLQIGETMICVHGKNRVEKALRSLPGVSARMDPAAGALRVTYPPALSMECLWEAASQAGCPGWSGAALSPQDKKP